MDERVSMDGSPWIEVPGNGPIPVPTTIEEWMAPSTYVGQNINWFMTRGLLYDAHVPKELVNHFYYSEEHRRTFQYVLDAAQGSEYLNLVINACHDITHPDHQQWLMTTMMNKSQAAAEFMIIDLTKNGEEIRQLRELRNTIWQILT